MKNFFVIGLVGLQASGKTEATSMFIEEGASRVRMGDVVWDEVRNRGLEVNQDNVAKVAQDLRDKEGLGAIAKRSVPRIEAEGEESKFVVVDGIRGIEEVQIFRNEFGDNFYLLSIKASTETRYERIKARDREDDIESLEEFREKDERELSWGLEEAMEDADFEITNEGSIEELKEKFSQIVGEIKDENKIES